MPALDTLLGFALLNIGLALVPGADVLCILANSLRAGFAAGARTCLGIACGGLLHVAAACLGLAGLLHALPGALQALQLAGAIYLGWLGWQLLCAGIDPAALPEADPQPFRQGLLSTLLNPKIALFFIAVLPQFVDPRLAPAALQALLLGLLSVLSGLAVNLCTARLGAHLRRRLQGRSRWRRGLQRGAGGLLIGLGLRCALDLRS